MKTQKDVIEPAEFQLFLSEKLVKHATEEANQKYARFVIKGIESIARLPAGSEFDSNLEKITKLINVTADSMIAGAMQTPLSTRGTGEISVIYSRIRKGSIFAAASGQDTMEQWIDAAKNLRDAHPCPSTEKIVNTVLLECLIHAKEPLARKILKDLPAPDQVVDVFWDMSTHRLSAVDVACKCRNEDLNLLLMGERHDLDAAWKDAFEKYRTDQGNESTITGALPSIFAHKNDLLASAARRYSNLIDDKILAFEYFSSHLQAIEFTLNEKKIQLDQYQREVKFDHRDLIQNAFEKYPEGDKWQVASAAMFLMATIDRSPEMASICNTMMPAMIQKNDSFFGISLLAYLTFYCSDVKPENPQETQFNSHLFAAAVDNLRIAGIDMQLLKDSYDPKSLIRAIKNDSDGMDTLLALHTHDLIDLEKKDHRNWTLESHLPKELREKWKSMKKAVKAKKIADAAIGDIFQEMGLLPLKP